MPKINTSINIDADLKKDAQRLFHELGMDLTTAINIFLRKAVNVRGIPFEIKQNLSNETIDSLNEFEKMKNKSGEYKRYSSLQEVINKEL